jgi:hypothetical protein
MTVLTQGRPQGNRQPTYPEPDSLIVAEWPLNKRETARVSIEFFRGTWLINARKWFEGEDGELRPGKGIALSVKHLPRLAEAIDRSLVISRERGLIAPEQEGDGQAAKVAPAQ